MNVSEIPLCQPPLPSHSSETYDLKLDVLTVGKSQKMAEFFRLLGDSTRLRILGMLAQQELCVCNLAQALEISESAISHQLRTLRSLRLVSYEKRGRRVYYKLLDHHVLDLYSAVAEHLDEVETAQL